MEGALSCLLPVLLLFPLPRSLGSKEDEDTLPQYVPQYALEVCFLGPWILGRALQACRGPEVGVGGHENGPPPLLLGRVRVALGGRQKGWTVPALGHSHLHSALWQGEMASEPVWLFMCRTGLLRTSFPWGIPE